MKNFHEGVANHSSGADCGSTSAAKIRTQNNCTLKLCNIDFTRKQHADSLFFGYVAEEVHGVLNERVFFFAQIFDVEAEGASRNDTYGHDAEESECRIETYVTTHCSHHRQCELRTFSPRFSPPLGQGLPVWRPLCPHIL